MSGDTLITLITSPESETSWPREDDFDKILW